MTNRIKHLHEIKGRHVVRVAVPEELRGIVGTRELREWLGTDAKLAARNAPAVIGRFYQQIDDARAAITSQTPTLKTVAQAHYASELLQDDRGRVGNGSSSVAELNAATAPHRALLLRLLVAGELSVAESEALMGYAANALNASGTPMPDVDRMSLLKGLAEVQLEAMARFEERDTGKISPAVTVSALLQPEPAISAPTSAHGRAASPVTTGESLKELLEKCHAERMAGGGSLSPGTMNEHKVAIRMFEEFIGPGTPARAITRTDMREYKDALIQTPGNYAQRFPGLTLPMSIVANKKRSKPYPTLNPNTINNKWIGHVSTVLNWALSNGYVDDNPARGIKVDTGKGYAAPSRVAFNPDDLKRIFGGPLFADPATYDSHQWALLIALYSGARSSSEIRRIKISDIYEEQGIPVFDLVEATKNVHSKRLVPIHKTLIDLGLLDYVERLKKKNKATLFWDWNPSDKINRWFLRTYKAEVGIVDDRKVFHSFRHTLKTALARHGVNRDISDLITGHKDQSVGGIYIGDASVTMIKAMSEGLNKVDFNIPLNQCNPCDQERK